MPLIKIYKQVRERWNLTKGLCFSVETRYRFDMDEYSYLERRPECVVHHLGRCGALLVKAPVDARFEPLAGTVGGWAVWDRAPAIRGERRRELNADLVVEIARGGLKADNGDTFTIVEESDHGRNILGAGAAGRPIFGARDERQATARDEDPRDFHVVRGGDRDDPRPASPGRGGEGDAGAGPLGVLSPCGSLRLVLPPGYRAESDGPHKLVVIGGDRHHTTNWAILPSLIEQEHPDWRLVPVASEPAPKHVDPYTFDRTEAARPRSGKRRPVAVTGQGSLF